MIGDTIRSLRDERGMTQEQLAAAVGVSPVAVQYYESNTWRPGMPVLVKMANHFGVLITDIVTHCSLYRDPETGDLVLLESLGNNSVKVYGTIKQSGIMQ